MLITVDAGSPEPIYRQIAGQIRGAISRRELRVGDRLPSVRDLADALDVNMHTVRAAYAQLREEGLLDVGRGRPVTVLAEATTTARVAELAIQLVAEARRFGLDDSAIERVLRQQM